MFTDVFMRASFHKAKVLLVLLMLPMTQGCKGLNFQLRMQVLGGDTSRDIDGLREAPYVAIRDTQQDEKEFHPTSSSKGIPGPLSNPWRRQKFSATPTSSSVIAHYAQRPENRRKSPTSSKENDEWNAKKVAIEVIEKAHQTGTLTPEKFHSNQIAKEYQARFPDSGYLDPQEQGSRTRSRINKILKGLKLRRCDISTKSKQEIDALIEQRKQELNATPHQRTQLTLGLRGRTHQRLSRIGCPHMLQRTYLGMQ